MAVPPNYVGEINSPWVGALMTVTVAIFLGAFGFYLVKGSVDRDYHTGVGQIIATTPLSRTLYALGKWLSNFAILSVMILILVVAGIATNLLVGKAPLELWKLISPLLLLGLPWMAVVASVAVLFEMIGWLRGGIGNVVYFFLFLLLVTASLANQTNQPMLDMLGISLVGNSIIRAARLAYPGIEAGFSFNLGGSNTASQRFPYHGIDWTASIVLQRFFFILIAFLLILLASALFDRFSSSEVSRRGKTRGKSSPSPVEIPAAVPSQQVTLTPLRSTRRFRFGRLYLVELKMLLKGHRWWWYVISLGLIVGQFAVPHESKPAMLAASWLWLILLLSELGTRETHYNTREIVYSAPHPTLNQLACYMAGCCYAARPDGFRSFHVLSNSR